jgi:hypothetical protein
MSVSKVIAGNGTVRSVIVHSVIVRIVIVRSVIVRSVIVRRVVVDLVGHVSLLWPQATRTS